MFRWVAIVSSLGERIEFFIPAQAGIAPAAIEGPPACTLCEPERFYSFRRDGGRIGQHLSFIGFDDQGA